MQNSEKAKLFELPASKARLRDISQIVWKRKSGDPTHPDNASDPDWQAGYLLGCHSLNDSADDLNAEWKARGKPDAANKTDNTQPERQRIDAFRAWKAGYWAGRYTRL